MRYFHRRTLSGLLMHWRWLVRRVHRHLIHHRHKYVSGGMIHMALIVFVGDAACAALPLPHFIVIVVEAHKHVLVPVAAAIGHMGFMLEREADKQKVKQAEARLISCKMREIA